MTQVMNTTGLGRAARPLAALAAVAALAACAGQPPTMPATQEAAQYRAHARNYYHPPGPPWDPWGPYIREASQRFDVPQTWIRAVMNQESGGQEFVVSVPGAMGLMQVMPFTYDLMREQYALGDDAYDPYNNVLAGTAYIRQMYDIYGSPGFLAAYNAGPGRLDDYLTRNRPLPAETRHYVAAIGPQIVFDSPHNRSQADLMAMNHARGDDAVQSGGPSPLDPGLSHSVSVAWARRSGGDDQEAEEVAYVPPPAAGRAGSATAAGSVRAAWAAREQGEPGAPVEVAQAGVAQAGVAQAAAAPRMELAPTPRQVPIPAAPDLQLASARIVSPPAPELADSVAEAPDPAPVARTRHVRFRLVEPALADTLPVRAEGARGVVAGHWSIQVGAFGTAGAANHAAGSARAQEATLLAHAHAEVASVRDRHGKVYRARLTGLSRDAAMRACRRLGREDCLVVSPEGA